MLHTEQRPVHIIALKARRTRPLPRYPHTWVNWGQVGRMVKALRQNGCTHMVLAGTVRRPNLRSLRPDLGLLLALPRLLRTLRGGDDSVLRRVIGFFESKGLDGRRPGRRRAASAGACRATWAACRRRRRMRRPSHGAWRFWWRWGRSMSGRRWSPRANGSSPSRAPAARTQCCADLPAKACPVPKRGRRGGWCSRQMAEARSGVAARLARGGPAHGRTRGAGGSGGDRRAGRRRRVSGAGGVRAAADAAGVFVIGLDRPIAAACNVAISGNRAAPSSSTCARGAFRAPANGSTSPWAGGFGRARAARRRRLRDRRAAVRPGRRSARNGVGGPRAGRRLAPMGSERPPRRGDAALARTTRPSPAWLTDTAQRDSFIGAVKAARLAGLVVMTSGLRQEDLMPFVARLNDERLFLVTVEPAS